MQPRDAENIVHFTYKLPVFPPTACLPAADSVRGPCWLCLLAGRVARWSPQELWVFSATWTTCRMAPVTGGPPGSRAKLLPGEEGARSPAALGCPAPDGLLSGCPGRMQVPGQPRASHGKSRRRDSDPSPPKGCYSLRQAWRSESTCLVSTYTAASRSQVGNGCCSLSGVPVGPAAWGHHCHVEPEAAGPRIRIFGPMLLCIHL